MKKRISKNNPEMVKAKEELINVAAEVIARGSEVKAQINAVLQKKSSQVTRLGEQLGRWPGATVKIVQQTKAGEGRCTLESAW